MSHILQQSDKGIVESILISCISSPLAPLSLTSQYILTTLQSAQPLSQLRLTCLLLPSIVKVLQQRDQSVHEPLSILILPQLKQGLNHSDPRSRSRSMHILQTLHPSLMCIHGLETEKLWESFASLMHALDQRALHLIQPLWTSHFPLFINSQDQNDWLSILLKRSAFHSNVNVRRMALTSFLELGQKKLADDDISYEDLLLSLVPAFDHERIIVDDVLRDKLTGYLQLLLVKRAEGVRLSFISDFLSRVTSVNETHETMKLATIQFLCGAMLASISGRYQDLGDLSYEDMTELSRTCTRSLSAIEGMNPVECRRQTQAIILSIFSSVSLSLFNIRDNSGIIVQQLVSLVAAALPSPSLDQQLSELSWRQRINDERLLIRALKLHPQNLFDLLHHLEWNKEGKQDVSDWVASLLNGKSNYHPLLVRSLVIFICPFLNPSPGLNPFYLASCSDNVDSKAAWLTQCLADSCHVWAEKKSLWHQQILTHTFNTLLPSLISSHITSTQAGLMDEEWDCSLLSALISLSSLTSVYVSSGIKESADLDISMTRLKGSLPILEATPSHYLSTLCLLLSTHHHPLDQLEPSLMKVCSMETSNHHCLSLRALARKLLVQQCTCAMDEGLFLAVMESCILDLEWASDQCLEDTIQALAVALNRLPSDFSEVSSDGRVVEIMSRLVRDLPHVMVQASKGGKVAGPLAPRVISLLFHPSLFEISSTSSLLIDDVIPMVLRGGMGVRLSFLLMGHLGRMTMAALEQGRSIPHYLSPERVACFISLGVFAQEDPSFIRQSNKPAAVGKMKKKQLAGQGATPEVLLPSRVALCAILDALIERGDQCEFIDQVARCLFRAVRGLGATREGGQSSHVNSMKIRIWQALCLIARGMSPSASIELLSQAWQSCILESTAEQPNVRPMVQLFVTRLFLRDTSSIKTLLMPALSDYGRTSYQASVSVCLVALHLMTELKRKDIGSGLTDQLKNALFPWALHHRHAVRVPVQAMLRQVFQREGDQEGLMQSIGRFLENNVEMNRMISGSIKAALNASSLDESTSFLGLFSCQPNTNCDGESDVLGLEWPLYARDRLPMDLASLVPRLLKKLNRASYLRSAAAGGNMDPVSMPTSNHDCLEEEEEEEEGDGEEEGGRVMPLNELDPEPSPFPHPSFHQLRPTLAHDEDQLLHEAVADKAEILVRARFCAKGLVVVASLLQNLPNIAGLCRTCESMSCEALVVPSRLLVQSEEFKRQSVTSERWLRLLESSPQDLAAFLTERKADGYTIVAVEQASQSVSLEQYRFPKRVCMILGNEQNGVPSSILELVDVCVEIPMLGVTRSMNAHVSGAMCIWSYVQQHQLESTA